MHYNKAFIICNSGKAFFFYCHQNFFPNHYLFRNNKKNFLKDKVERDIAPQVLSSEYLYDEIFKYEGIVFCFHSSKQKFLCFGVTYNWVM
jgi:hypothetical protein